MRIRWRSNEIENNYVYISRFVSYDIIVLALIGNYFFFLKPLFYYYYYVVFSLFLLLFERTCRSFCIGSFTICLHEIHSVHHFGCSKSAEVVGYVVVTTRSLTFDYFFGRRQNNSTVFNHTCASYTLELDENSEK